MGIPKYINPFTGSDSNSGDSALQARATPPAAVDNTDFLFCDDTHYLRASQWSWGAAANCTLGRYSPNGPGSYPKITLQAPGSTNALNIQGAGIATISEVAFVDCQSNTNGGVIGSGLVAATGKGANLVLYRVIGRNCNWNFVRINVGGMQAPDVFRMLECDLDLIGEDGIFGGAQVLFEVAYSTIRNPSMNTNTGDCIGFFNADPALVWVHHNHLEHPRDFKQVVIFDPTTVGAGSGILEYNVMIGYTGADSANHAVFNTEVPSIVRGNYMLTSGILMALNADNCAVDSNVCDIRGYRSGQGSVQLYSSNTRVVHNAFVADRLYSGVLLSTGSGRSGDAFRNNILVNIANGVQRGNGTALTLSSNCLHNVTTPYVDHLSAPLSSANDVLANPLFVDPLNARSGLREDSPCWRAGAQIAWGLTDCRGVPFALPVDIGPWAYPQHARAA